MDKTQNYGWRAPPPHTTAYIAPAVARLLEEAGARTVLDAGCGNGALAANLTSLGYSVTGVDGDPGGIDIARERCPSAAFFVGSFDDAPPDVFDAVCSTEVVEHLYAPHELADYCYRALKPGGTLLISTPYHGYAKNLAISLLGKWDPHFSPLWHGGHVKFWSKATLTQLLERSGFEVLRFVGVGRLPFLWKSMILVARRPGARAVRP